MFSCVEQLSDVIPDPYKNEEAARAANAGRIYYLL